jgi:hypothetical protein
MIPLIVGGVDEPAPALQRGGGLPPVPPVNRPVRRVPGRWGWGSPPHHHLAASTRALKMGSGTTSALPASSGSAPGSSEGRAGTGGSARVRWRGARRSLGACHHPPALAWCLLRRFALRVAHRHWAAAGRGEQRSDRVGDRRLGWLLALVGELLAGVIPRELPEGHRTRCRCFQ